MQTKKNYTIHQLERELAQTTKQLSKRERGRNLSLIIMGRERERERECERECLKYKNKIHIYQNTSIFYPKHLLYTILNIRLILCRLLLTHVRYNCVTEVFTSLFVWKVLLLNIEINWITVHLNTLEETERKLKETEDDRDRIIKEKDEEIAELNHNMTALEHSYKRILDVSVGTFFIALDSKSEHWRTKCMKISRYKYSISQNLFFHCGQGLFSVNYQWIWKIWIF